MRLGNLLLLILAAELIYLAMAVLRAVVLRRENMPDEAADFWRKSRNAALMAVVTLGLYYLI